MGLRALWTARSVAIVGASTRSGAPGRLAIEFLRRYGYPGRVVPVNPNDPGAYPSVVAAGGAELALIVVPPAAVTAALDDCAAAGVPVAIVGTSGFAEIGPEGRAAQDDLAARARAAGIRLVGPNCIGAAGFTTGLIASFSPMFRGGIDLTPGGIGFASASGALGFGTASLALERGMGLFGAVTTGNEADVTTIEVLTAMASEPECTTLLGYAESLRDGPALRALAAAGKPTALLVAGRSTAGARAARSHTGVLATPDRVVDGALRQLGIVRVSDVDELLDVGDAFALCQRPAGPRVAVVTTSGGSGILAADAIEARGLRLAELDQSTVDSLKEIVPPYGSVANPVDVTATVMSDRTLVARALAAIDRDPGVDIIVVCFCVLVGEDVDAIVSALSVVDKPVVVARTGAEGLARDATTALRAARVPAYPTPGRAVRAAAALWQAARLRPGAPAEQRRATASPEPPPGGTAEAPGATTTPEPPPGGTAEAPSATATPEPARGAMAARAPAGSIGDTDEPGLKRWLASAGIAVPRGRVVRDAVAATEAVTDLGGTAVLKVVAPGVVHKGRIGGVVTDVTPAAAGATYQRLMAIDGATGVLVEERIPGGVELLVGVAPSPLGPALTVGAGGVHTEALDDAAVRLLPVSEDDIREALAEVRAARAIPDHGPTVELVARVAILAGALPPGTALDLNPVVGATVLDAALTREA